MNTIMKMKLLAALLMAPTLLVMAQNHTPTAIKYTQVGYYDSQPTGTWMGSFITSDDDNFQQHTYTLVAGPGDADNGKFYIDGRKLKNSVVFDHTVQDTFNIRVRTEDAFGAWWEETAEFIVYDNGGPLAINYTVVDLSDFPQEERLMATISVGKEINGEKMIDPNSATDYTYTLVSGEGDTDNSLFKIVNDGIYNIAILEHKAQKDFSIRVRATDLNGRFIERKQEFSIVPHGMPTDIEYEDITTDDNQQKGTLMGIMKAVNSDNADTHTYTLVAGDGDDDNAKFYIIGDGLYNRVVLLHDTQSIYSIRVRATDDDGHYFEKTEKLMIQPTHKPQILVDVINLYENQPEGTLMLQFTNAEQDQNNLFTIAIIEDPTTDYAYFSIDGYGFYNNVRLFCEEKTYYHLKVEVKDPEGYSMIIDGRLKLIAEPTVAQSGGRGSGTLNNGGTTVNQPATTGVLAPKNVSAITVGKTVATGSAVEFFNNETIGKSGISTETVTHTGYPNPFENEFVVDYTLPVDMKVELKLFNNVGQQVAAIVDGIQPAGKHSASWNAANSDNGKLPKGSYIYQLVTTPMDGGAGKTFTGKLMKIK